MRRTISACLFAAAGLVWSVTPALAQNALGDGRGLEKNLRQGGGGLGNTPRADFGAEVRMRNAIVTGNAPGGRSFRSSAGYTDPSDFTSRLGGDTLYNFRRDSIYSGLAGMGYRGTEALQYQFSQTTGNTAAKDLTLSRFGGGTAYQARGADQTSTASATVNSGGIGSASWANVNGRTGTLRSTAAYTSNRSLTPIAIGMRAGEEGQNDTLAASGLLGVKLLINKPVIPGTPEPFVAPGAPTESSKPTTPISSPLGALPLVAEKVGDKAPVEKAVNPLAAQPVRTAYDEYRERLGRYGEVLKPKDEAGAPKNGAKTPTTRPGERPEDKPTDSKPGDVKPEDKDKPASPDASTGGDKPAGTSSTSKKDDSAITGVPEWERRMIEIRRALHPEPKVKSKDPYKSARNEDGTLDPAKVKALKAAEDTKRSAELRRRLDKDTIDLIRKASDERTKMYISSAGVTGAQRDIFAEHVREAQKLMADERYMDAEERFSRALAVKSGDAACMGGRVNAQIGAGLYVAASTNLKETLVSHPEMAGMRYESYLLPTQPRLKAIAEQLRKNITSDDPITARVPRESALILAYIGRQIEDKSMVHDGLREFAREAPESDSVFLELIERVWQGDAPAGKPAGK